MTIEGRGSNLGANIERAIGADATATVEQRVKHAVDQAGERANDVAHRVKDGLDGRVSWIRDAVENRPLTALAVAFAVGYTLATIRARR